MTEHERMNYWWCRAKAAEAATQRVRDLHQRMAVYDTPISDCGHDIETYGIELDDGEVYCSKHVAYYVCEYCWNLDENGNADTEYPCPTIRALDGAEL